MEKNKKTISGIQYSSYIDIDAKFNIKINNPLANMQEDYADFEALAIMLKCKNPDAKFVIHFDESKAIWNGRFDTTDAKVNAYLRFLYRITRFQEAFPEWVEISEDNKEIVEKFKNKLEQAKEDEKISNNIPTQPASELKEGMKEEKRIETKLSHMDEGRKYLQKLYHKSYSDNELTDDIYNQLPNGLFNIKNDEIPHKDKRILPTGAYDIWSIDKKGNLCIFELKKNKNNEKSGVISELFFYSVYAKEFLCDKKFLHINDKEKNVRGYKVLYDAVNADKIKGVKAIFLLGEGIHSAINELKPDIKKLLNTNTFGIEFDFMEYDIEKINAIET